MKLPYNVHTKEVQNDRQTADCKYEKSLIAIQAKLKDFPDIARLPNPKDKLEEIRLKKYDLELQITQEKDAKRRMALRQEHASTNGYEGRLRAYINLQEQEINARRKVVEWTDRRKKALVKMYGGIPEDYELIDVPQDEIMYALQARHIIYNEDTQELSYDIQPLWRAEDKRFIVSPGWVQGNEQLLEVDVTDFAEFENLAPFDFKLCFYRNNSTDEIVVKGFVKQPYGSWGAEPKKFTFVGEICRGFFTEDHEFLFS